jgi:Leucine-rich repeat (LRR) protein
MLEISGNRLRSLPDELSCLQNLKELQLSDNLLPGPPVSVFSKMTALSNINMSGQSRWTDDENLTFKISSSLLPMFDSGLLTLDVRQERYVRSIGESCPRPWDGLSLFHLGRALADLADRKPVATLLF